MEDLPDEVQEMISAGCYIDRRNFSFDERIHYKRTCLYCSHVWGGLHCPHDGAQNPCPNCDKRPETVEGDCDCEFDY